MSHSENRDRNCGQDVAAYALGALEPIEAQRFAEHLHTCAVCRDELAEFERAIAVLPMDVPEHRAPRRMRRRVMSAVRAEPRHQPRPQPRRGRIWFLPPRPALALGGAAVVAVAVVLGALSFGGSGQPRTRVFNAQVIGSRGTARITVGGGHAELVVRDFAPPPAGEIYEVWLARPHRPPAPTSALFSVTAHGNGDINVPGSLHGVTQVMVTVEPAGGSQVPTHPPVIRASLT
jgi:anti-sigma-K factor RskA